MSRNGRERREYRVRRLELRRLDEVETSETRVTNDGRKLEDGNVVDALVSVLERQSTSLWSTVGQRERRRVDLLSQIKTWSYPTTPIYWVALDATLV